MQHDTKSHKITLETHDAAVLGSPWEAREYDGEIAEHLLVRVLGRVADIRSGSHTPEVTDLRTGTNIPLLDQVKILAEMTRILEPVVTELVLSDIEDYLQDK